MYYNCSLWETYIAYVYSCKFLQNVNVYSHFISLFMCACHFVAFSNFSCIQRMSKQVLLLNFFSFIYLFTYLLRVFYLFGEQTNLKLSGFLRQAQNMWDLVAKKTLLLLIWWISLFLDSHRDYKDHFTRAICYVFILVFILKIFKYIIFWSSHK